jgi:hypothetical protein
MDCHSDKQNDWLRMASQPSGASLKGLMKSLVSFPQCLEPGGHAIVIFDIRRRTVSDQPLKKRWIELLIYSVVQRGSAFLILEIDVWRP